MAKKASKLDLDRRLSAGANSDQTEHSSGNETDMETPTSSAEEVESWQELGSTRVLAGAASASRKPLKARMTGDDIELSDFTLLEQLGEGAMGVVYRAAQKSFNNRIVAIKILFPHIAKNPKLVQRLYREGRAMFHLDHPNIVQSYAVDEDHGFHYVAMEYVDGQNMQKWLYHLKTVDVPDAVRIAIECAKALSYAHKHGIVHRDVKPDNILIASDGRVKLTDLGMVKMDEELSLTQTGHAVGTPWYMPLEQARNAKETDARSDIYALGCSLYAFLTGRPPFTGATIVEVIQAKERGTYVSARGANVAVPDRLDLIIGKMVQKLPKYRYQDCDEIIRDLESLHLANPVVSFIQPKADGKVETPPSDEEMPVNATERSIAENLNHSRAETAIDPDIWYVLFKKKDGTVAARKMTTDQIAKMLNDGSLGPTAKASHTKDNFRALATYKEFYTTALAKVSKRAADQLSDRVRNLYKKIDEDEQKAEAQRKQLYSDKDRETIAEACRNADLREYYLKQLALPVLAAAGGVALFFGFMYLIIKLMFD